MNFSRSRQRHDRSWLVFTLLMVTTTPIKDASALSGRPINCDGKKPNSYERTICNDSVLNSQDQDFEKQFSEKLKRINDADKPPHRFKNAQGLLDSVQKQLLSDIKRCDQGDILCIAGAYAKARAIVGGCFIEDNKCEKIAPSNSSTKGGTKPSQASRSDIIGFNRQQLLLSPYGLNYITGKEGLVLCFYDDIAGISTIGFGHVVDQKNHAPTRELKNQVPPTLWLRYKDGITMEKAKDLKNDDLKQIIEPMLSKITVKLNQCQVDTIISLAFNSGSGDKQNLWNLINDCQWEQVPAKMAEWNKVTKNGQKVVDPGLAIRRMEEGQIFSSCRYAIQHPKNYQCAEHETIRMESGIEIRETYKMRKGQSL